MIFQFERDGQVIERDYRPGCAPQTVTVEGRKFRRVISVPTLMFGDKVAGRETRFVANSIDPDHYKYHRGEFITDTDGQRKPVFKSKRERESFQQAANADGCRYAYETATRRPQREWKPRRRG